MSHADRMAVARPHEARVLWNLQQRGWAACEFGQGMLSEDVRRGLRMMNTPWRWMPDMIAVRDEVAYLVDAKSSNRRDTGNYDIEQSSLAAFQAFYNACGLPVVIVWYDGRCSFSSDLVAEGAPLRSGPFRGSGSGTPFWLWPKEGAHEFDDVFGPMRDQPPDGCA